MTEPRRRTSIAVLLLPSFNVMATTAFIDPFRAANYVAGDAVFDWRFVSPVGGTVRASNGMTMADVGALTDAGTGFDVVMVSASWTPEAYGDAAVLGWLRQCARFGATMGGLDTGAFVLAYAGLLNEAPATAHYEHIAAFRELFPEINVVEDLYTVHGNRLTCCGGMAGGDLALAMIRDLHGLDLANAAARYIFHDRLRSPSEGQFPAHFEPVGYRVPATLRRAIVAMESNLENPMAIDAVAGTAGVSQRQLERLFKAHTGVTPVQYYLEMRLDRARGMVTQTDMPMMAIGMACGFSSQEHFAKAYRNRFALAPSVDRKQGRVPFQFRSFPSFARVDGPKPGTKQLR